MYIFFNLEVKLDGGTTRVQMLNNYKWCDKDINKCGFAAIKTVDHDFNVLDMNEFKTIDEFFYYLYRTNNLEKYTLVVPSKEILAFILRYGKEIKAGNIVNDFLNRNIVIYECISNQNKIDAIPIYNNHDVLFFRSLCFAGVKSGTIQKDVLELVDNKLYMSINTMISIFKNIGIDNLLCPKPRKIEDVVTQLLNSKTKNKLSKTISQIENDKNLSKNIYKDTHVKCERNNKVFNFIVSSHAIYRFEERDFRKSVSAYDKVKMIKEMFVGSMFVCDVLDGKIEYYLCQRSMMLLVVRNLSEDTKRLSTVVKMNASRMKIVSEIISLNNTIGYGNTNSTSVKELEKRRVYLKSQLIGKDYDAYK